MVDTGETMKKETPSKKKDIQGSNQNVNLPSKDVDVFAGNEKKFYQKTYVFVLQYEHAT